MIKIGDLARICNVNAQTLRYYDSEGILKADIIDSSSGYRFYSLDAIEKYKKILFYKSLGFSLNEIKIIHASTNEELQEILKRKKIVLSESIEKYKKHIETIDTLCNESNRGTILSDILLLPFEDDPQIVGKWQLVGKLFKENDIDSFEEISDESVDYEIIFMPGGTFAWKYFWTKGILYRLSPKYTFAIPNAFSTIVKDGIRYMIVHFLNDECIDDGAESILLLYRQTDNIAYTEQQIRPHVDKTDLPFIDDVSVHGEWEVCDFVPEITLFNPNVQYSSAEELFVLRINFLSRGICMRAIKARRGESNMMLRYTKGFVLNDSEMTAEEYIIKNINSKEYLFVQHKSGDYFYGGMTPHWYVFNRKDN